MLSPPCLSSVHGISSVPGDLPALSLFIWQLQFRSGGLVVHCYTGFSLAHTDGSMSGL